MTPQPLYLPLYCFSLCAYLSPACVTAFHQITLVTELTSSYVTFASVPIFYCTRLACVLTLYHVTLSLCAYLIQSQLRLYTYTVYCLILACVPILYCINFSLCTQLVQSQLLAGIYTPCIAIPQPVYLVLLGTDREHEEADS